MSKCEADLESLTSWVNRTPAPPVGLGGPALLKTSHCNFRLYRQPAGFVEFGRGSTALRARRSAKEKLNLQQ